MTYHEIFKAGVLTTLVHVVWDQHKALLQLNIYLECVKLSGVPLMP